MSQNSVNKVTSREISLEVIYNVLEKGEFYDNARNASFDRYDVKDVDRAFISALAQGTIERKTELDYIISVYVDKKIEKLKPNIRNILRMSVYQIIYMDKVPDSAAVNEAVNLTVRKGYGGLKGFVNGVLRNIARTADGITYPGDSVKYSMPEWIVSHLCRELGEAGAKRGMEYFLEKPDLTIRPVPRCMVKGADKIRCMEEAADRLYKSIKDSGYDVRKGNIFGYALRIKNPGRVEEVTGYGDGGFMVQDESSMIPAHAAYEYMRLTGYGERINDGIKALDMCASPGGKVLNLAGFFGCGAQFEARDISRAKTDVIRANTARTGYNNITVRERDALVKYEEDFGKYDVIIADLPCSGLGVIAKKPDIKYNIREDDLDSLADIQGRMLDNAVCYAKTGGIIIYSTCTIDRKENEDVCVSLLDRHGKMLDMIDLSGYVPVKIRDDVMKEGYLKIAPGKYESDGFFVAAFRKTEGAF